MEPSEETRPAEKKSISGAKPVPKPKPAGEPVPTPEVQEQSIAPQSVVLASEPSRKQVKDVMDSIAQDVNACAKGQSGRVTVRFTVSGTTGVVLSSDVFDSGFEDAAIGTCAARAVRHAQFPRFSRDKLTIKYPFEF
jgi:hypothetical protein